MKVAILSESPPDESAIVILVVAVLGSSVDRVAGPPLRSRGWPSVRSLLPGVIRHLHFRTDADGLVVVVDSDSPVAHRETASETVCQDGCRLCELRLVAHSTLQRLPARPVRAPLKVAVGLAVPAIEAWYRVGVDATVTEAAWIQAHTGLRPRLPVYEGELEGGRIRHRPATTWAVGDPSRRTGDTADHATPRAVDGVPGISRS